MHFVVDQDNKIIFGWSAKCGCSHVKHIYWFLKTGNVENRIHTKKDLNPLPDDIQNYTTILIVRDPYKRIISGMLDKYRKDGEYRYLWKDSFLSFSQFVDELITNDWKSINLHHFTPQTSEYFDEKILHSKIIKLYDIGNINYEYIEQLYNKKIPECIMNRSQGHERRLREQKKDCYDKYVYDLHIDEYITYNVDTKYFYNEEIREDVFNFYIKDFIFFKENGVDYTNPDF